MARVVREDTDRCGLPDELDAVLARQFHLVLVRGSIFLGTAIDHDHLLGTETLGLSDGIDRRIARADHDDRFAQRNRLPIAGLYLFDNGESIVRPFEILTWNVERIRRAKSDADKDRVMPFP